MNAFNRLENQRREVMLFYKQFSEDQLKFKPEPASWNMLQVLRHLVTAESQSLIIIKRKISRAEELPNVNIQTKIRAFLLKIALALPIKFKAPKVAHVNEEYPDFDRMREEWSGIRNDFKKFLINLDENNFKKTVYQHPRAGFLTLKQAIVFMEDHIEHHRKQIDRIRRDKNFPAS